MEREQEQEKIKYRVIGWTYAYDERFPDMEDIDDRLLDVLIQEIRRCGYRFGGDDHENLDVCTPVFNNGKKLSVSWRSWGAIMAEAWEPLNQSPHAYMGWYMTELCGDVKYPPDADISLEDIVDEERLVY